MFKIVTLNLRHGGGKRIDRIASWLNDVDADFLICTEFQNGPSGDALLRHIAGPHHSVFRAVSSSLSQNSVVLIGPQDAQPFVVEPEAGDGHRIVACQWRDMIVTGVYFALGPAKASLFQYLLAHPFKTENVIVTGDFNTGLRGIDEIGRTFNCSDLFAALPSDGLHDLWRHKHGQDAREYSWTSHRGNPYRLDHAFGTSRVRDALIACDYDHAPRDGMTDHSALITRLSL